MDLEFFYNNQSSKIYEGNFENNYFNGKGTLFYNDGRIQYEGIIKNGFFWEEGFYYDISGEKTKFINGFPSKNKKYIDNFKIYYYSGKIHYCLSQKKEIIKGKEYYEIGTEKYIGNFKIIKMMDKDQNKLEKLRNKDEYNCIIEDGNGTTFNNYGKKVYQGGFKLGCYSGNGTLYEYNSSNDILYKIYEGSFLNGKFHGDGIK